MRAGVGRQVRKPGLAVVVLVAAGALLACRDAALDRDEAEVRSVVQAYFEGLMSGSPGTLDRAFHPGARLIGIGARGTLAIIPFHEWRDVVTEGGARGPDGFRNEILSADLHGVAATVKTKLTWPEVVYVEYLSLVRADGEWKIVNKIWHEERSAQSDRTGGRPSR